MHLASWHAWPRWRPTRPGRREPRRSPSAMSASRRVGDAGVRALGVGVHPGDRRAGEDVVELLQQHVLPQLVELVADLAGHPPAAAHHSSASRSSRSQRRLPTFVVDWLVSVPRCISKYSSPATPAPAAPPAISASTWSKNSSTVPSVSRGTPSRSAIRPRPLEHLAGRAAAAVAVAVRHQRPVAPAVVLEVALGVEHLRRGDLGVVGVDRREVGEHLRCRRVPPTRTCCAGRRFCLFQLSFWVTKRSQPPAAKICGSDAG